MSLNRTYNDSAPERADFASDVGSEPDGNLAAPRVIDPPAPPPTSTLARRMERAGMRPLDVASMLTTEPPPRVEVWEGFIGEGETVILFGKGKAGKSLLAASFALSALSGDETFLGQKLLPRAWALIADSENGEALAHRRLRGLGLRDVHAGPLEYFDCKGVDLGRQETRELIAEKVAEMTRAHPGPGLVIIDSVIGFGIPDEQRAEVVRPWIQGIHEAVLRGAGEHRVVVVFLAHTPHDVDRPRGSGDWVNAVNVAISVKKESGGDFRVRVFEARDMGDYASVRYELLAETGGTRFELKRLGNAVSAPLALGAEETAALAAAKAHLASPNTQPVEMRRRLGLTASGSDKDTEARGRAIVALLKARQTNPQAGKDQLSKMAIADGAPGKAVKWATATDQRLHALLDDASIHPVAMSEA